MTTSLDRKRARGTLRADRLRSSRGLELVTRSPAPPPGLSKAATDAWKDCARLTIQLKTLTVYDIPLLELLARTLGSCSELEETVRTDGAILVSGSVRKAHPGLAALDRARALGHRLLGEFGLAPQSREKLSLEPPPTFNPFRDDGDRRVSSLAKRRDDSKRIIQLLRKESRT